MYTEEMRIKIFNPLLSAVSSVLRNRYSTLF